MMKRGRLAELRQVAEHRSLTRDEAAELFRAVDQLLDANRLASDSLIRVVKTLDRILAARQVLQVLNTCASCQGSGYSPIARRYSDEWYGHGDFDPEAYGAKPLRVNDPEIAALARRNVEHDPEFYGEGPKAIVRETHRLWALFRNQWGHHLIQADVDALVAEGRLPDFKTSPTADEVNAWSIRTAGHDSINHWICVKARCARNNEPHLCSECHGSGEPGGAECRMPDGTPTQSATRYVRAWRALDKPIARATRSRCYGFDPGLSFTSIDRPFSSWHIGVREARALSAALSDPGLDAKHNADAARLMRSIARWCDVNDLPPSTRAKFDAWLNRDAKNRSKK